MEEPINVRYTFVMMLAIADPEGYVIGTDVAISRRLNMPKKEFLDCLAVLMAPDPDSNSQELDGRRITVSENERGYHIVNFVTYRDIKDQKDRREYMREYMRKRRERIGKCAYCGRAGDIGDDHIVPTSAGGSDEDSNKAPCCKTCNASKKAYTLPQWLCKSDLVRSKATLDVAMLNDDVRRIFNEQLELERDVNFVKLCKSQLAQLTQEEEDAESESEEEERLRPGTDLFSGFDGLDQESKTEILDLAKRISRACKVKFETSEYAHSFVAWAHAEVTDQFERGSIDDIINKMADSEKPIRKRFKYFETAIQERHDERNGHG